MKAGKTHDQILKKFAPFKDYLAEIDALIKQESTQKDDQKRIALDDDKKDSEKEDTSVVHLPCFVLDADDDGDITDTAKKVGKKKPTMVSVMAEDMAPFKEHAQNTKQQFVKLIEEPTELTDLIDLLKASTLATMKCDDGDGNMVIVGDLNGYGESNHAPSLRKAIVPKASLQKIVNAVKQVLRHRKMRRSQRLDLEMFGISSTPARIGNNSYLN